ncbi:MAG: dual specificity protein phosphatase family protein [Planctomycetes bacterium]|nr:dual specificity protein phosphatase family protein [Planctomycetota bacterium]
MRQIIDRQLWIGNAADLRDPRRVLAAGVTAVVDLAANEPPTTFPRELIQLRFPLADGSMNPEWLLKLAVDSVAALIRAKIATMICCSCGMNRSLCILAGAIALADNRSFAEALRELATSGAADVSPGMASQVQAMVTSRAVDYE